MLLVVIVEVELCSISSEWSRTEEVELDEADEPDIKEWSSGKSV